MNSAFDYVIDNDLGLQTDYTYTGKDGKCKVSNGSRFTLNEYADVDEGSEASLLGALNRGPVSVAINASGLWF